LALAHDRDVLVLVAARAVRAREGIVVHFEDIDVSHTVDVGNPTAANVGL
jgi:hypothetical protein